MTDPKRALDFLDIVADLKRTKRTGWVENGVRDVESVAEHMYRMGIYTMLSEDKQLDSAHLTRLALAHDVGEAIIGDLSPKQMRDQRISSEKKHEMEKAALLTISDTLGAPHGPTFMKLFMEYEDCETPEAKWIKDIDRLEMCLQAFYYEREQGVDLSCFYSSCEGKMKHPWLKACYEELKKRRNAYLQTHTLQIRAERSLTTTATSNIVCLSASCLAFGAAIGYLIGKRGSM
ncbi:HD domain-containing protein 2-like protein [Diplonema papillatum]|nr:HD domain-containing protein 2-like protein [Diplonema papillatum]|eukprot:gene6886-10564_t